MSAPHEIILLAALARNGVIGRNNTLPWRLKADLARFKAVTMGHPILMGRKTWESLGRPLPGRRNLVVTRAAGYQAAGAEVFTELGTALQGAAGETLFVIGGAELFRQLMDVADALILTEIHADVDGDTYFPTFDRSRFIETGREPHAADADNDYAFDFVEYRRRQA